MSTAGICWSAISRLKRPAIVARARGDKAEDSVIIISSESSEEEDDEAEQLSDVQRYRHLKGLLKISHECEMSVLLTHTVQVTMQMRAMKRVHGWSNKVAKS